MGLSSITVSTAICVSYLTYRDCHHPVPSWIKCIAFRGLATVLCVRSTVQETKSPEKVEPRSNMDVIVENIENANGDKRKQEQHARRYDDSHSLVRMATNLDYMTSRLKDEDAKNTLRDQWRFLGKVIDRLMFFLSVTILVVVFGMFFVNHDNAHVTNTSATVH